MDLPPLPAETTLQPAEQRLGQWDFSIEMQGSPVARTLTRVILTSDRLIVLQLATPRVAMRLASRLGRDPRRSGFMGEMGSWHVVLNARLGDLPAPTFGRVPIDHPTALRSTRALVVGTQRFWVGEDPSAEAMASAVRGRWESIRTRPNGPGQPPD